MLFKNAICSTSFMPSMYCASFLKISSTVPKFPPVSRSPASNPGFVALDLFLVASVLTFDGCFLDTSTPISANASNNLVVTTPAIFSSTPFS